MFYNKPIFFEQNRVFRVYSGGYLLGKFLGKNFTDDNYPEEWIASDVRALNEGSTDEYEGISKIEGEKIYLSDALKKYKQEIIGAKKKLPILVKYLDSAIRLPVQAHPTKAFSKKYFNSEYGKEECWYILDTRENASICFGFREGVDEDEFRRAIIKSETDKSVMENLLIRYPVKAGDVVYIPANTVHAICEGCLILEVQEPTDFTIQPERWCGDYRLSDREMYLGLTVDEAMECFDFNSQKKPFVTPKLIKAEERITVEALISSEQTDSFSLTRVKLNGGNFEISENAIYIVTRGSGAIFNSFGYERKIKQGDYFLLPAYAINNFKIFGDDIEILICK